MLFRNLLPICALLCATTAPADTIAIIGSGSVAGALGPEFAALGHEIVYGSRDPSRDKVKDLVVRTGDGASATTPLEAAFRADIVVLAVPGMVVEEVTRGLGDLSGKIIIDPTNALKDGPDGTLMMDGRVYIADAPPYVDVRGYRSVICRPDGFVINSAAS